MAVMPPPSLANVEGEGEVKEAQVNIQEIYDGMAGSMHKSMSNKYPYKPVLKDDVS